MRLNSVRRDLKNGASTGRGVQDVAARRGFWRPSEFSADYKRQFAELPSETLRRARQEQASGCVVAASRAHDGKVVEDCDGAA